MSIWSELEAQASAHGYRWAVVRDDPQASSLSTMQVKVGPGILHGILSTTLDIGSTTGLSLFDGITGPRAPVTFNGTVSGNVLFPDIEQLLWIGPMRMRFLNGLVVATDVSVSNQHFTTLIYI